MRFSVGCLQFKIGMIGGWFDLRVQLNLVPSTSIKNAGQFMCRPTAFDIGLQFFKFSAAKLLSLKNILLSRASISLFNS